MLVGNSFHCNQRTIIHFFGIYFIGTVADLTIMLALMAGRRANEAMTFVNEGNVLLPIFFSRLFSESNQKTSSGQTTAGPLTLSVAPN